ncbi:AUX/IAA domain [Sesbania bispinosa]|nr:AUX/IAA domain [Sesbania bispinosa]
MELHQTFKLNNHGFIIKSNTPPSVSKSENHVENKRVLEGSLGHSLQHFPLLVWSGQPNEEDDHNNGKKHRTKYTTNTNKKEENHMVGWPPIKSWRKKELNDQQHPTGGMMIRNDMMQAHDQSNTGSNT